MNDVQNVFPDPDPTVAEECDLLSGEVSDTSEAPDTNAGGAADAASADNASDPEVPAPSGTDPDPDPADATPAENGLDELRGELKRLREELEARDALHKRIAREYDEFFSLYPSVALDSLSDEVWRDVENGTPLPAAYALAERRRYMTSLRAEKANERSRHCSAGGVESTTSDFFTPDEVRAMSQSDVRANLSKIMLSMKKWH